MSERIKPEEQRGLCKLIVTFVAKGPRERAVVEFLFARSIKSRVDVKHISEQEIVDDCPGGPETPGAVRSLITRLRVDLDSFFSEVAEGRKQRWKVSIPLRSYALRFEVNHPPARPGDLVRALWEPYIASERPVRLYYPEPQFFRDERSTYLHSASVPTRAAKGHFAYLQAHDELVPSFGFVPSGIVQAMVALFELFQRLNVPLTAEALRAGSAMPERDEDVIVIGTPTTMPLITMLEASSRLRTCPHGVLPNPQASDSTPYLDTPDEGPRGVPANFIKWALMTRKPHRHPGRVMTILASSHDRALHAMTGSLARQEDLEALAFLFEPRMTFPNRFQSVFRVDMLRAEEDSYVEQVGPTIAFSLESTS